MGRPVGENLCGLFNFPYRKRTMNRSNYSDAGFLKMCKSRPNLPLTYSETMRFTLLSLKEDMNRSDKPLELYNAAKVVYEGLSEMNKAAFKHIMLDMEYHCRFGKD